MRKATTAAIAALIGSAALAAGNLLPDSFVADLCQRQKTGVSYLKAEGGMPEGISVTTDKALDPVYKIETSAAVPCAVKFMDVCYIDEEGDLLFTRRGDLDSLEELEQYVEKNNIRFSLCFGPTMLRDGELCVPLSYTLGEINEYYPRAALCQLDKLHYVVVTANMEDPNFSKPTVSIFAQELQKLGIPTAYALDGGQTATIVMNDQVINTVSYGSEREISDIIYFATAIPSQQSE